MTNMIDDKEEKTDEGYCTKSDENIKLNVDLSSEINDETTSKNPLIPSNTQPLACVSTSINNSYGIGSKEDKKDEYNYHTRPDVDRNPSIKCFNISQMISGQNETNIVTQNSISDSEGEYAEIYDNEIIKKQTVETQDEHLSDEGPVRKRLDSKIFENIPLFEVIRPKSLKDVVGQTHLINNNNGSIKNFIRLGYLPSMILHGPPGIGKTSIASILAQETGYVFVELSATDATVSDLKELLATIEKENQRRIKKDVGYLRVVVFIDEIHRFTKTQQDFLLPFIELGVFSFIGATTLNPEMRIRRAIISRCQIFQLKALEPNEIDMVIRKAVLYENIRRRVLRNLRSLSFDDECLRLLVKRSNGDIRAAVNLIELVSTHYNIKDLVYEIGRHEPFILDLGSLKSAIDSLKINISGLQDTNNLSLFLELYDSMRYIKKNRTITSKFPGDFGNISQKDYKFSCEFSSSKAMSEKLPFNKTEDGMEQSKSRASKSTAKDLSKVLISKSEKNSIIMKIMIPNKRKKRVEDEDEVLNLDSCSDYNEEHKRFQLDISGYNDLEKSYIAQMEVSDDSDVEAGPLYFDREEDLQPIDMQRISLTKFFAVSSIYSLIRLLDRGETPFFIGKQLILFTTIYLKSDNSDLVKTMALLKSLKNSNTDILTTLSNCVLRLTRARKMNPSASHNFLQKLKFIKQYCYHELQEHSKKDADHKCVLNDDSVEVVYDSDLLEDLLKPVNEASSKPSKPIFEIESLDSFRNSNREQCMHIPQGIDDEDYWSKSTYSSVIDISSDSQSNLNAEELRNTSCDLAHRNQQDSNSDDSESNETNLSLIKNPGIHLE